MQSLTLLNNQYRIIKQLGEGGFGKTYLAEDTHMPSGRHCVIKQLKPDAENSQIYQLIQERFQREAAILEDLGRNHPQIPTLYGYFREADKFYLVQELIEGQTLTQKIHISGVMSESSVKSLLSELLPVFDYVHTRRIVHRDVKPDNILIRVSDNLPVLIDFGAVRETMGTVVNSQGQSTSSIVIGTPGYMPSEQAAGRPIFSSDLYALGLTAIYLLTGKIPQQLDTDPQTGEILWRHYALSVSPTFSSILDRAIMSHPRDRFSSAKEMLTALQGQAVPMASTIGSPAVNIPPTVPSYPALNIAQSAVASTSSVKQILLTSAIAGGLIGMSTIVGLALTRPQQFVVSSSPENTLISNSKNSIAPPSDPAALSSTHQQLSSRSAAKTTPKNHSTVNNLSFENLNKSPENTDPQKVALDQYSYINNRQYETAWSHLTSSYRGDRSIFPDGYQSYTDWWNTVESVTPSQPQILERNHQTATVELTLTLAMNSGEVSTEQRRVQLIWNSPQNAWEIAKNTRL